VRVSAVGSAPVMPMMTSESAEGPGPDRDGDGDDKIAASAAPVRSVPLAPGTGLAVNKNNLRALLSRKRVRFCWSARRDWEGGFL
jgi:hypothetical protein